jgi:fibronectin type 3 domain-containing protein
MRRGPLMVAALAATVAWHPLLAQTPTVPDLWLVPVDDGVRIQLPRAPVPNHGFLVYRGPVAGPLELITPLPVTPGGSDDVSAVLGPDLPVLMGALRSTTPGELLRRLGAESFTADVMSVLFPRVAELLGRAYVDRDAEAGEEYLYHVILLDGDGREQAGTGRTGRVTVVPRAPDPPTGLTAESARGRVTLSWVYPAHRGNPDDVVFGFHVYRAEGDGEFRRITDMPAVRGDGEGISAADRTAEEGLTYRYKVRAYDLAGRPSEPGEAIRVAHYDPTPPLMPLGLAAVEGDGRVTLAWRISPEERVTGYRVERSRGLDRPYEPITPDPVPAYAPAWVDSAVVGGTQYFYRVVALGAGGAESPPTSAVTAVPFDRTPPAPPTDLVARVAERQLHLSWTPSVSDDVQGYHVYRGDASDRLTRLTDRPLDARSFVDLGFDGRGLNPGRSYTLRVTAVDRSFNESEPVTVQSLIPDDEPPTPPTGLQLRSIHGRHVEVRWSPSGALDVERYVITRAGDTGDATLGEFSAHGRLEARDTAVQRGQRYEYRLVAVDSAGNRSEPVIASVDVRRSTPPPAPRHAHATATTGGVRVEWERVVDTELAGYRVYRADLPTGQYRVLSGLIRPDADLAYVDPEGRSHHHYQVRAVDRSGNESAPGPRTGVSQP